MFNNFQSGPTKKTSVQPQDQAKTPTLLMQQSSEGAKKEEEEKNDINDSKQLDPDDFVMSNTSLSIHNQSQVMGLETDRGDQADLHELSKVNESHTSDFNESKVHMRNDPIFDDFDSTQQRFEMPSKLPQNILLGLQDQSTNLDGSDFEMGQDSNDELPQLQKTSSELVHA